MQKYNNNHNHNHNKIAKKNILIDIITSSKKERLDKKSK